jgi:protein ImuA
LRRLQLAAQAHDGPAFVLRDVSAGVQPSAAPLRLRLAPAGPDELALQILKRRGPPLLQPLRLALPPVLSAPVRRRALRDAAAALPAGEGAAVDAAAASGFR